MNHQMESNVTLLVNIFHDKQQSKIGRTSNKRERNLSDSDESDETIEDQSSASTSSCGTPFELLTNQLSLFTKNEGFSLAKPNQSKRRKAEEQLGQLRSLLPNSLATVKARISERQNVLDLTTNYMENMQRNVNTYNESVKKLQCQLNNFITPACEKEKMDSMKVGNVENKICFAEFDGEYQFLCGNLSFQKITKKTSVEHSRIDCFIKKEHRQKFHEYVEKVRTERRENARVIVESKFPMDLTLKNDILLTTRTNHYLFVKVLLSTNKKFDRLHVTLMENDEVFSLDETTSYKC